MKSKLVLNITGAFLAFFAIVTLFMSTSVIFDWFGIREKEGSYVLFVVVANFICSILYLVAAYGFFALKKWTTLTLTIAVGLLVATFIGLGIHIYAERTYELKTVGAMTLRTLLTIVFAVISHQFIVKEKGRSRS